MKKIFALILCFMFIAVPISAYAEGETEEINTENILPEEGPAPAPTEEKGTDWNEIKDTISGAFVEWIEPNLEEISVVVALIGYGIANFKKLTNVLKSLGIMNNNTITISKENATLMEQAMSAVTGYEERIKVLLDHYTSLAETLVQTAEDKKKLESELVEIKNYLKISADANLEFSNELAELLGLANIPNYVKEEIGARHVAAKNNIIEAEKKAVALLTAPEEVTVDDGEKQED
jgi:hypothetical protein